MARLYVYSVSYLEGSEEQLNEVLADRIYNRCEGVGRKGYSLCTQRRSVCAEGSMGIKGRQRRVNCV